MRFLVLVLVILVLGLNALQRPGPAMPPTPNVPGLTAAAELSLRAVDPGKIRAHVRFLASDRDECYRQMRPVGMNAAFSGVWSKPDRQHMQVAAAN